MLDEFSVKFEQEYVIENRVFDFYIKDTNILIELNPTYTHNLLGNHFNNWKPKEDMKKLSFGKN